MDAPKHIRSWLAVNDDVPADKLKCPLCGEWFASIDHLAPYHWETFWCAKCEMHPLQPVTCRLCGGTGEWMPGMKECPDCKTQVPRSDALLIWWHRRRAAHHFAIRNNSWSVFHHGYDYHIAYMKFHEMQEERLLNL